MATNVTVTNVGSAARRHVVSLQPVAARGWRAGFANLLRKEVSQWWGTRTWLALLLFLIALIDGAVVVSGGPPGLAGTLALEHYMKAVRVFFMFAPLFTAVRAITATQGAIIDEKQLGTAAWILSKPVSRTAFIAAKLVASTATFLLLGVVAPAAVFYGVCMPMWGRAPDLAPFLASMPILALHLFFYLALTLLLGTLLNGRGAVTAIATGAAFMGSFLGTVLPKAAAMSPWGLPQLAESVGLGQTLPDFWALAVASTVALSLLCVGAAIWRIQREEF